ncbi:tetratricopeptide repeat protein [Treponema sp.]|uniref:tetratricopeptide repeat protein n=1 Tax=Treponema sp. TaxID=166 RepID=UPI00388EF572
MKKIFLSVIFMFFFTSVFSQIVPKKPQPSDYSWRILQEAQFAFDRGNFATAMNLANKAKANRVAESDYEVYILDVALSPLAVRRAGESFDSVLEVLKERDQSEAISIINRYLKLYGETYFQYSVHKMEDWVDEKRVYPEADFLIGKIYRLEGEYQTAIDFYEKARLSSSFLDVPEQIYDILYEMADLLNHQGKTEDYKQALLLILDNDPNYKDIVLRRAMLKIIDANKSSNVDRFFDLFRASSLKTLNALYSISVIFDKEKESENSIFCSALGAVESYSHILDSISGRDAGFSYTTLALFLEKIGEYEDIVLWCEENHFWNYLIDFCNKCIERGDIIYANSMLEVISEYAPDAYCRKAAATAIVR